MDEKAKILNAQTPYEALLLPTTATPEEAKYQYFKLVKKYNPEKEEEAFRAIRKAYEELKDPAKKAAADVMLFTAPPGRVRFSGINTSTASQVKLNREIEVLSKANLQDPSHKKKLLDALKQRAVLLGKNGKWNEALADLDKIEELEGLTEDVRENRVFILSRQALKLAERGLYAEAAHRWRRCLRLAPDRSYLLHNLAVCATLMINRQEEDKYWVDTLKAWHTELAAKGDDAYLKNLIVETHRRFGGRYLNQTGDENLRSEVSQIQAPPVQTPHAVESVQVTKPPAAPQPDPKMVVGPPKIKTTAPPGSPEQAGLDAFSRQDWKSAIQHFESHLKTHPEDGNIMDKLGWALLHAGQGNRAFALWLKMAKEGPDQETGKESFIKAKIDTAKDLRRRMMHNPALVQLKDVLKHFPDSKEVLRELGDIHRDREDWVNASYYYEKAFEMDQNDKELRHILRQLKTKARSVRAIM